MYLKAQNKDKSGIYSKVINNDEPDSIKVRCKWVYKHVLAKSVSNVWRRLWDMLVFTCLVIVAPALIVIGIVKLL